MPLPEECFLVSFIYVTDVIVKLSIFNIYKTLFYAEKTGFISGSNKAVLGVHTKE